MFLPAFCTDDVRLKGRMPYLRSFAAIYRRNEAWYARPDARSTSVTQRSGVEYGTRGKRAIYLCNDAAAEWRVPYNTAGTQPKAFLLMWGRWRSVSEPDEGDTQKSAELFADQ